MRFRTALLGAGSGLVMMLSGCGNGPPPDSNSSSAAAGGGSGGGPVQVSTGGTPVKTINESDALKFDQAAVTVKTGDVVEWDNAGSATHNVTFDEGTKSGDMNSGDKFQVKFTAAGAYHYRCTYHPGMEGTVTAG